LFAEVTFLAGKEKAVKGTRHSEEQIIAILKQGKAGVATRVMPTARNQGADLLPLEAKYGGMDCSEAKPLKQLEDDKRKLKYVVAELTLDNRALKDVLSKNW